ncbi:hypothetical protein [Mycobacterium vicinigordonae]|uniref:Uncharacterized protein n=1 Tax=Mycobacterium vicinigordonae TaxID=1719132 RepID=A0A7D6DZ19_9MYCO|nr:hypothetical protein [Mycobacterium vicinigordonae]QLL06001.1 hypothetical protein H0P51_19750 [Mycobacterium vicinigordonae]
MSGNNPPSIEEMRGFANQIRGASPEQLLVEVHENALGQWKRNINDVVGALRGAHDLVADNHVDVGEVSELYDSATQTANNLNISGQTVKDNIQASLEVAEAVQQIIQSAFDRIQRQSGA